MHFDIYVEDISGKIMLDHLMSRITSNSEKATYSVCSYQGVGSIPKHMTSAKDIRGKQLLTNLPKLLNGLGKTYAAQKDSYPRHLILVCDLDDKNLDDFLKQLQTFLRQCHDQPETSFCMAIEEGEAWLLGDFDAIQTAYPKAKKSEYDTYRQDSICGTWEKLADIVGYDYHGKSFWEIGLEKSRWADKISPHVDIERNQSPSFQHFVAELQKYMD